MTIKMIIEKKFRIFYISLGISTVIIMYLFSIEKIKNNIEHYMLFFLLYFICVFVGLFIYFMNSDFHMATLVVGAASTVGVLLIVPEIPIRTFIPCMFMFIMFGGRILTDFLYTKQAMFIYILLIPFIMINTQNITIKPKLTVVKIYTLFAVNLEIIVGKFHKKYNTR